MVLVCGVATALWAAPALASAAPSLWRGAPMGLKALGADKPTPSTAPAGFSAIAAVEPNDDVAGAPDLTPATQTGELDASVDKVDVYKVHLEVGESVYARLDADPSTDFDIFLYGPSTTSIDVNDPLTLNLYWEYPNGVAWKAQTAGYYYLVVYSGTWTTPTPGDGGAGPYTLTWFKNPVLSLDKNASVIGYKKPFVTWGVFDNVNTASPNVGEWMRLFAKQVDGSWKIVSSAGECDVDSYGEYGFVVYPTKKTTYAAGVDTGTNPAIQTNLFSSSVTVTPQVFLGTPTPATTVRRNTSTPWVVTLRPKHSPFINNVVWFRIYKWNGREYVYKGKLGSKNRNYTDYTRAITSLYLKPGKYQIKCVAETDSEHYKTLSPARTITVK